MICLSRKMALSFKQIILLLALLLGTSHAYYSELKEPSYISDSLLRDLFTDLLNKDLVDENTSDEYIDDEALPMNNARLALIARATKAQNERMSDYDSILERTNPHPSLRDSEYMQHSSLWGHQFMSGGGGEGPHVKTQVKTDATLPAYCNPPNPCPVGYSEHQGCINDFENSASFSREYQAAQECMCDSEHMFECPTNPAQDQSNGEQNFGFLTRQYPQEHKNLVAKKFWVKKVS
jgi:Neuroendocrine protein 7B2 precursor (Secretogranin V)